MVNVDAPVIVGTGTVSVIVPVPEAVLVGHTVVMVAVPVV
jgi:hypothetical protein